MASCNYWSNLGSVHQGPITDGWTEAVWNTKFARHCYTWPTLQSNPRPSDLESNALSTGPHAAHYLAAVITYLGPNHIVNTSPYCSLGCKKSKCTFSGRLNIEPTIGQRVGPGGRRGACTCKMIIFLCHLWTLYKRLSHMKSPLYCSSGYNYKSPWWLNCPVHLSLSLSWVELWVHVRQSQIWLKL